MLTIERLPVLSDNYMYLVHESETGTTAVVDPPEVAPVEARLNANGWSLDWILITHHHPDHINGVEELKAKHGCRVAGPAAENDKIPGIDVQLRGGDRFELGAAVAEMIETPGHTLGHITYWFEDDNALFSADALFALGCGRVFEGTPAQMWDSLSKLRELPDEALVYCGHEYTLGNARFAITVDPDNEALRERCEEIERLRAAGEPTVPSLLGVEKATNPFLRPDDADIRQFLGMEDASDAEVFTEIRTRKDNA